MTSQLNPSLALRHQQAGQRAAHGQQWAQAALEFEQACRFAPKDGMLWLHLARARLSGGQIEAAAQAGRESVALLPTHLLGYKFLAETLRQLGRPDQVASLCASLPATVARDEDFLIAHADALAASGQPAEAVPVYIQALGMNVKNATAHYRLGLAMQSLDMGTQAAICFETAVQLDPQGRTPVHALALALLVMQQANNADWAALRPHQQQLLKLVEAGEDAVVANIAPFSLLALDSSPAQQLRVARLRSQELSRTIAPLPATTRAAAGAAAPRLRLGYLSCDFHNHATVALIGEQLELLDRERFELFLYCHSRDDGSPEQARVRAAADHYRDVRSLTDAEAAQLMRSDGIDIAIDLKGHTQDSRMQILAYRPAPLQLSFLGYPGSSGADFIDYVIGDPVVTPIEHGAHYSERIAQLPHSYQPNDSLRALPPKPTRAELGLPEDKLLLCCFNQSYKINAPQLDLWAQILREAPNTALWLLNWNEAAPRRLSAELQQRGVDPQRLYFSTRVSVAENLARLQCADLFLDTWPCNAHTTASEALWAGVPVLTVPGDTFASRVAASLVRACGLAEFACADGAAYVTKALALLREPALLRAAQAHLRTERLSLPLFDGPRYARNFKALLLRMWTRHQAGLPPTHLPADAPPLGPSPAKLVQVA